MPVSEAYNMDCMEYMGKFPDNYFDLAVVDPEYGIGITKRNGTGDYSRNNLKICKKKWDNKRPSKKYFTELFRVSRNQVIFGANFFNLPPSRGWICWYKTDEVKGRDFSEFEIAFTSFDIPARHISLKPFIRGGQRIHPTQKPVALYKWTLTNYAKPGDKILDTHLGSGSSRIAAYDLGFDFYATELDADYFTDEETRFKNHIDQGEIFTPEELQAAVYQDRELF